MLHDLKFKIQNSTLRTLFASFRIPHSAFRTSIRALRASLHTSHFTLRTSGGFTYIALLAALVIIGISLGAAGKYWQNVALRDKEEELLFRGDQYRQAIMRYYLTIPAMPQYPPSIDDLLKDPRSAAGRRHLRQKYKDPITGKDFVEIRDTLSRRIIGVRSESDETPLKQANFPDIYQDFAGKDKYSQWQFILNVPTPATQLRGAPPIPGRTWLPTPATPPAPARP